MTNSELPTAYEQLSELISSGEMIESQINGVIDEHIMHEDSCEVCEEASDFGDENLIEQIVKTYRDSISNSTIKKIFQTYVENFLPAEDVWNEQYLRAWLIEVATCPSSDLSLLQAAAGDFDAFVYNFRSEEGDESLAERTKEFAFMFAAHKDCTPEILEGLAKDLHDKVLGENFECSPGPFETCDYCQDLVQEAIAKLK